MMVENNRILVDAQWVRSKLETGNIIVVDCRYNLMYREYGIREYQKGHIPGSYFLESMIHKSSPPLFS